MCSSDDKARFKNEENAIQTAMKYFKKSVMNIVMEI